MFMWFQRLTLLVVVLAFSMLVGPSLNEYRKVVQAHQDFEKTKASFSTRQDAVKYWKERLQSRGVELPEGAYELTGSTNEYDLTLEYSRWIPIGKNHRIELKFSKSS